MDLQSTSVLILSMIIFGLVIWWALNNKSQPRRQMSLEAQRAYEERKGQILADQNYYQSQVRQQNFLQNKRNVARGLNERYGSLF